jgi:hypothetical protein
MLALLASIPVGSVTGCGGGDSSTAAAPIPVPAQNITPPPAGTGSAPLAPAPPAAGPVTSNTPPASGPFGGGQGKILFTEDKYLAQSVLQLDLATRLISRLATPDTSAFATIIGGVSRANDGRFAVLSSPGTLNTASIVIYDSVGNLTTRIATGYSYINSRDTAVISPDGSVVGFLVEGIKFLSVGLVNTSTKQIRIIELLATSSVNGLPANSPTAAWVGNTVLLVLTNRALYRIDTQLATFTKRFDLDLAAPQYSKLASDGRTLWFDQKKGNPYGKTAWSIDLETGDVVRRSLRSAGWGQAAPCLSPDGKWMLAQEGLATVSGSIGSVDYTITATPISIPPIDTNNLPNEVLDSAGKKIRASEATVWF